MRRARRVRWPALAAAVVAAMIAAAVFLLLAGDSKDLAAARAINLKPGDLPGWTVKPAHKENAAGDQIDSRIQHCPGVSSGTGTAEAGSPEFLWGEGGPGAVQVQSDVSVRHSPAAVGRDLAQARSGRVLACMARALEGVRVPTSRGVTLVIGDVRTESVRVPVTAADGTAGIRVRMSMGALGLSVPVTLDVLGFGAGRYEVTLMTEILGESPPTALEQHLLTVLVSRATAQAP